MPKGKYKRIKQRWNVKANTPTEEYVKELEAQVARERIENMQLTGINDYLIDRLSKVQKK